MTESIARTNQFFGGLNPHVYRVFFTHGEMDPRRSLGPQEDLNPNAPVVVMSLQSAGRDFGSPADTDYAVLLYTKARARELILQWIVDAVSRYIFLCSWHSGLVSFRRLEDHVLA